MTLHARRMRPQLAALHDDTLTAGEATVVRVHVQACVECAAELRRLRELDALLCAARPSAPECDAEAVRAGFVDALARSGVLQRKPGVRWMAYAYVLPALLAAAWLGTAPIRKHTAQVPAPAHRTGAATQIAARELRHAPLFSRVDGETDSVVALVGAPAPTALVEPTEPRFLGSRRHRARRHHRRLPVRQLEPASAAPVVLTAFAERADDRVVDNEADENSAPVPRLWVQVTGATPPPVLEVTVRTASADEPGSARVAGARRGDDGCLVWAQSTLTEKETTPCLVLLASH